MSPAPNPNLWLRLSRRPGQFVWVIPVALVGLLLIVIVASVVG